MNQQALSPNLPAFVAEDDFEMGSQFLDVFIRAGDRVVGFFAGSLIIVALWALFTLL